MRFQFSRKIWRFHPSTSRKIKQKGALTLISVFMFFIFSTLGLSIIYFSQIYLKLAGYKKNSTLLRYASENGIKQGFDQLANLLSAAPSPISLSPAEVDELLLDAINNGTYCVERILSSEIPLYSQGSGGKLRWQNSTLFSLLDLKKEDYYFKTTYKTEIESTGTLRNFKPERKSTLEALIEIHVGHIPLPSIPLLIGKDLAQTQKQDFLTENNISIQSPSQNQVTPEPFSSGEGLIPQDTSSQVYKALKIDIFYPQNLSNSQLREALGLEFSNEPVPDGVYLIQDDLGLGGIFVQGDLNEMILAIEHDYQVIAFHQREYHWLLKFNPSTGKTYFSSPEESKSFDLIPKGLIIVEGKIQSLGGGIVDPAGNTISLSEEKIPCILQGVNLTIISSDKITLSSHLIHQGVKWQEGVPYLKESTSQLNIIATGQSIIGENSGEGAIIIGEPSPSDINIQASLTATGEGFSIEGQEKEVNILGNLHTPSYHGDRNSLKIRIDERHQIQEDLSQNAPMTATPILSLSHIEITSWYEN